MESNAADLVWQTPFKELVQEKMKMQ